MKTRIERTIRRIQETKVEAGEFSLDLYYDDTAAKGKEYVALVVFNYTRHTLSRRRFAASDFTKALAAAEKFVKYGLIEKKK